MNRLLATSPVGKNGQTVVPAQIRKMFKLREGRGAVGFYLHGNHVEIAPIKVEKGEYSLEQLDKLDSLAREKGGVVFKNATAAKAHLDIL